MPHTKPARSVNGRPFLKTRWLLPGHLEVRISPSVLPGPDGDDVWLHLTTLAGTPVGDPLAIPVSRAGKTRPVRICVPEGIAALWVEANGHGLRLVRVVKTPLDRSAESPLKAAWPDLYPASASAPPGRSGDERTYGTSAKSGGRESEGERP